MTIFWIIIDQPTYESEDASGEALLQSNTSSTILV